MLRKLLCLLLTAILTLSVLPARAMHEGMPDYVPVELCVYGNLTDYRKIRGLYRDQELYFSADTVCELSGAQVKAVSPDEVTFLMHRGLREFTVTVEGEISEEYNGTACRIKTSAAWVDGAFYVSAWDVLSYMGAVVSFGADERAQVHFLVYMPYTVLDLYAESTEVNHHRFGWGEADGKWIDPEDIMGMSAAGTVLFGYESNIMAFVNGDYADHVEKTIYSDVLMEILHANSNETITPAEPFAGQAEAIADAIGLPMPWLQKVVDLLGDLNGRDMLAQGFGAALDVSGGLVSMNTELLSAISAMNQYTSMSRSLQRLLRDTLCRVKPGEALYNELPLLFDAARDINGIVEGTYSQNRVLLEEALYGVSNIGASLLNGNLPSAIWSTITSIVSMDYADEDSLLNDDKRITFAAVSSDVCLLAYKLLIRDSNAFSDANLCLGREDTAMQENLRMDIILCLKASLTARQQLLATGWLTDEAQSAMQARAQATAELINRAETAVAVPLGVIPTPPEDISWVEKLHLLDGLTVVHPLFRLHNGFVRPVEHLKEVPQGYVPIYTFEDFRQIADSCPSSKAVTSKKVPLTKANQAKYILMNDIVMPDSYDSAAVFAGELDGNGYTMRNVSMPLFGRLYNATVKNLALEVDCTHTDTGNHKYYSSHASDSYYFGFIAHNYYYGKGTQNYIDNCSVTGTLRLDAIDVTYGALVGGRGDAFITNCYSNVDAVISADIVYAGGLCGFGNTVYNCINEGDLTVNARTYRMNSIGGIGSRYNAQISTCYNAGDITVHLGSDARCQAGGIVGLQESYSDDGAPHVLNCYNVGDITVTGYEPASAGETSFGCPAGGIVGASQGEGADIKYCWNGGGITSRMAGGIAGQPLGINIEDCSNVGEVTGQQYAGGIAATDMRDARLLRCVNAGPVSGGQAASLVATHSEYTTSEGNGQDCYVVDTALPDATPAIPGSTVTRLAPEAMARRDNLPALDFEQLWIIRNHLPIPLDHDRTVLRIDYDTDFIVPEVDASAPAVLPDEAVEGVGAASAVPTELPRQPDEPTPTEAPASAQPAAPDVAFSLASLPAGKKYAVYSAPSKKAWRGASGKASVSTNGDVWAAGWEGDWLLIMYETSKGSVRVGYVSAAKLKGKVGVDAALDFPRQAARLSAPADLTDDVARAASSITTLKAGTEVTLLGSYEGRWAYVETTFKKKTVRGFIPLTCLETAP